MNYDIRIRNSYDGEGRLELDRLAFLSAQVKRIAQKALLLQAFGYSKVALPSKYKKFLDIFLTERKMDGGDILLTLDARDFEGLPLQLDLFSDKSKLRMLTPVALVIKTLQAALDENGDKGLLDAPILDDLLNFKKFFQNEAEQLWLSNRGTLPDVKISGRELARIDSIYKTIPAPEEVLLNGIVDEMKYSRKQFILITADKQRVLVIPNAADMLLSLKDYFGQEITLRGTAHFRPSGQLSYIQLRAFDKASEGDHVFSARPNKIGIQQKIALQLKEGKKNNPLDDIIGQWPGDETAEEFNQMLKDLD